MTMTPTKILGTFFLLLFAMLATASAEESPDMEVDTLPGSYLGDRTELNDLKSFLILAADNNNELRAAFQKWQAAIKKAVQADTLPDPKFSFGYYTTPLETRGGPARYKYGLSQTLPFSESSITKSKWRCVKLMVSRRSLTV